MKIATWNINGLRSGFEKFNEFITAESPDIICLQEVKIADKDLSDSHKNIPGYYCYFAHAQKPGYSGVAIYSRIKPESVIYGLGKDEFDSEGRVILAKFKNFDLLNCYFPHSSRDLARLPYKVRFNEAFLNFIKGMECNRLIVCGDLNVAHQEIDLARPKDNRKNAGFTQIERGWMDKIIASGLIDVYRKMYSEKIEYTWWANFFHARERNIGWRIDYFLVCKELFKKIRDCQIEKKYFGSDHCPVILEIENGQRT